MAAQPRSGSLAEGADADVVGVLEGRDWLKIRLPDGSFGFVRSASIPAVDEPRRRRRSSQPRHLRPPGSGDIYVGQPVQGQAAVHDTATLVVEERAVPLYAVDGFGGEPALAMQQYVDSEGRAVNCSPLESKGFVCTLRDGTDVAKAALVNGAARVTPDAPADYVAQQEDAQKAKRGIWRDGVDKVEAVPLSRGATTLSDSYVPGVPYAGAKGVPAAFTAASPVNGLAVIGDQPFTLADGDPTPVLYRPGVGWGFWDRYFVWRTAPASWVPRLEQLHPHGSNLRQVNLTNYGFVMTQAYFVGPAVDVSFVPNQPPIPVGFSPYASPVFAPYLDPGYVAVGAAAAVGLAGIVGGVLPGPRGFGPPGGRRLAVSIPVRVSGRRAGLDRGFGRAGSGRVDVRVSAPCPVARDTWPGLAVLGRISAVRWACLARPWWRRFGHFGGPAWGMPGPCRWAGGWAARWRWDSACQPGWCARHDGRQARRVCRWGMAWPARRDADGDGRPARRHADDGRRTTRRDAHDGGGRPGGMPTMGGGRPGGMPMGGAADPAACR